jgi:hypothetical protein
LRLELLSLVSLSSCKSKFGRVGVIISVERSIGIRRGGEGFEAGGGELEMWEERFGAKGLVFYRVGRARAQRVDGYDGRG